jgi:hypothetical protein
MKKWTALEQNKEVLEDIIANAHYAYSCIGLPYSYILKQMKKDYPGSQLVNNISENELKSIILNLELVDLINIGILDLQH